MTNRAVRERLLASTIIAGAIIASAPAFAQVTTNAAPAATDASAEPAGEIVVTGSLIRNPNLTSATPVNVISDQEIFKRAPSTTEEVLRALPGVTPGIGSQVNNGANGTNTVDLRGLGAQRNLVLIDGDRVVPTLANGAVDLDFIPLALLQRVDVLTGGASTTYGADAVSGVVNFITRKDFSGVDVRSTYKITGRGDGQTTRTDVTLGGNFADDRGNAVLNIGYTKVKPVYQTRGFALYGVDSTKGTASGSSFTSTPTVLSFPTADLQVNPSGTALVPYYQGYNFNPYNIFQTPLTRKSAYAAAHYDVADNIEVYARGMASQNIVKSIIAPSGVFGNELTVPANNPYLTPSMRDTICTQDGIALGATCNGSTALDLPAVYRRLVELGPRISTFEDNIYDARAGMKFDLGHSLSLDISGSYGRSEQEETQSGYVLNSRVQQALNADNTTTCTDPSSGCVPLNLFGPAGSITAAQVGFIQGQSTIRIVTELKQARALLSGDFGYTVPGAAAPISFAVGAEYRDYTYNRIPDAFAQDPTELGGAGGAVLPFKGSYDVKEAYGELNAPIINDKPFFEELSLEGGVRYSSYNIKAPGNPSFNTWTYKGGATWAPVEGIRLRGNYQRAVRAPNIGELFSPTVVGLTNLTVDPCAGSAPTSNANLRAICLAQGAPAATIGSIGQPSAGQANATFVTSTSLKPEKADTFTLGVVLTPRNAVPGLSVSVDYFNIKINNAITFELPGDAIAACFGNITAASATSAACTSIQRSPANGRLSGSAANTPGLLLPETNLGRLKTDGIDLTVDYTRKFGNVGLDLNFVGTWTDHLKFRASPSSEDRDCVGYYSANCGPTLGQITPEFTWNQRSTLTFGPANVSLLWRHIDKVQYEPGLPPLFSGTITGTGALVGKTVNFNKIPSFNYFDLTLGGDVKPHLNVSFTIQNLFDKAPPIVGGQAGTTTADSGNTFPSTYDTLGRTFAISARVSF